MAPPIPDARIADEPIPGPIPEERDIESIASGGASAGIAW
eukprot:CAMPEP_0181245530 /NCGR_PEP_ID=MMETSP1096-20121128/43476_1 /TAXON_ID=156174 ORGANISM="Chrysochromulina ericina, Strain CCMP281" /NCGR_SAMPLE_ID=MMETSP1096 /ASSEMBLY_ACC=CAM_ASM_000453 /LENGTH=39 /DNA_ID= /DNA_START= /DNA_END= /DNA_ORIENTATION=